MTIYIYLKNKNRKIYFWMKEEKAVLFLSIYGIPYSIRVKEVEITVIFPSLMALTG